MTRNGFVAMFGGFIHLGDFLASISNVYIAIEKRIASVTILQKYSAYNPFLFAHLMSYFETGTPFRDHH